MNAVSKIREAEPAPLSDLLTEGLAKLRAPFPDHQVSKLPKESRKQADEPKANPASAINCQICGGWHHRGAVHLDYVGHAALTDRLLDTDPLWSWEPVAFGPDGMPAFDRNGGLWIRLTVCGVTRLGYGNAEGKQGGDAVKEIIGDALRNAAMRFGSALDLWHKGDLHLPQEGDESRDDYRAPSAVVSAARVAIECLNSPAECADWWVKNKAGLDGKPKSDVDEIIGYLAARKKATGPAAAPAETAKPATYGAVKNGSAKPPVGADDPFNDEIPF